MSGTFAELKLGLVSADEEAKVKHVVEQVNCLAGEFGKFVAALSLFDFCEWKISEVCGSRAFQNPGAPQSLFEELKLLSSWKLVAARDSVMTIYHFGIIVRALRVRAAKISSLRSILLHSEIKKGEKLFLSQFPFWERLRHAVAHSAELSEDLENKEINSYTGSYSSRGINLSGGGKLFMSSVVDGRTYTVTHQGCILKCDISSETLSKLARILNLYQTAFNPIFRAPLPPVAATR